MVPPDQPAFSSCVIKGSPAAAGTLFVVRSAAAKTGDAGAGAALSDTALTADPAETDVFFTADVPVLCGAEGPVAAIAGVFFCKACPHAENTRSTSRRSPQRSWERYRIVLRSTIWKRYCSQNENPRLFQTQKIQMQELHRPPSRKGYCVRNLPNFFRPFLISIGDIVSAPTSGSGRSAQTIILRNHSSEKRSPSPRIRYRFGKRERAFRRPNTSYGSRKRFL